MLARNGGSASATSLTFENRFAVIDRRDNDQSIEQQPVPGPGLRLGPRIRRGVSRRPVPAGVSVDLQCAERIDARQYRLIAHGCTSADQGSGQRQKYSDSFSLRLVLQVVLDHGAIRCSPGPVPGIHENFPWPRPGCPSSGTGNRGSCTPRAARLRPRSNGGTRPSPVPCHPRRHAGGTSRRKSSAPGSG